MIAPNTLDAIKARVTPADVARWHGVALRSRGSDNYGLCPLHDEKTPSFWANDRRFHCFGCGAHGDAIGLAMRAGSRSFIEAVRFIAERAGVTLDGERKARREPPPSREALLASEIATVKAARIHYAPYDTPLTRSADINGGIERFNRKTSARVRRIAPFAWEIGAPHDSDPLWPLLIEQAVIETFAGRAPAEWALRHWRHFPNLRCAIVDRAAALLHAIAGVSSEGKGRRAA